MAILVVGKNTSLSSSAASQLHEHENYVLKIYNQETNIYIRVDLKVNKSKDLIYSFHYANKLFNIYYDRGAAGGIPKVGDEVVEEDGDLDPGQLVARAEARSSTEGCVNIGGTGDRRRLFLVM